MAEVTAREEDGIVRPLLFLTAGGHGDKSVICSQSSWEETNGVSVSGAITER